ncbi:replicative DNA helicase [Clostridium sp. BSD9I1]|uniref:replicative DNA helicase n=1 Tax=Clostridium sp. BSD9I1 TaxID=2003589 RepID=UPI00164714C9|nr:replicative DNA helicase [Clostridium sp. BSD9I1]
MDINRFYNLEAEVNILGAILKDNEAILTVIDLLDNDDFYNTRHKLIYGAAVNLYEGDIPIDLVTLSDKLGESLPEAGGISYLSEVYTSYLPVYNAKYYGEIIKEKSNLRRMINLLEFKKKELQDKDKSCDDIVDSLEDAFLKLRTKDNVQDGNTEEALMQVTEMLQRRYENGGDIPGISTGYRVIDKMLGGLNKEEFIILAARPSMGKTAMALNIALNTAINENAKVAFFNLEMGKNQILERALSALGEINCSSIKTGALKDEEWSKIMKVSNDLSKSSLYIYDKVFTLRSIIAECKRLKIQKGLDIVIIDYLQLINTEERSESRNLDISKISRQLKLLAKELEITVIALSQLSRAPEARANHRPMLSDLRESGSLEQDADVVMFLYRDAYYNPDAENKDILENIVAKNRNGQVGIARLKWKPEYQKVI